MTFQNNRMINSALNSALNAIKSAKRLVSNNASLSSYHTALENMALELEGISKQNGYTLQAHDQKHDKISVALEIASAAVKSATRLASKDPSLSRFHEELSKMALELAGISEQVNKNASQAGDQKKNKDYQLSDVADEEQKKIDQELIDFLQKDAASIPQKKVSIDAVDDKTKTSSIDNFNFNLNLNQPGTSNLFSNLFDNSPTINPFPLNSVEPRWNDNTHEVKTLDESYRLMDMGNFNQRATNLELVKPKPNSRISQADSTQTGFMPFSDLKFTSNFQPNIPTNPFYQPSPEQVRNVFEQFSNQNLFEPLSIKLPNNGNQEIQTLDKSYHLEDNILPYDEKLDDQEEEVTFAIDKQKLQSIIDEAEVLKNATETRLSKKTGIVNGLRTLLNDTIRAAELHRIMGVYWQNAANNLGITLETLLEEKDKFEQPPEVVPPRLNKKPKPMTFSNASKFENQPKFSDSTEEKSNDPLIVLSAEALKGIFDRGISLKDTLKPLGLTESQSRTAGDNFLREEATKVGVSTEILLDQLVAFEKKQKYNR